MQPRATDAYSISVVRRGKDRGLRTRSLSRLTHCFEPPLRMAHIDHPACRVTPQRKRTPSFPNPPMSVSLKDSARCGCRCCSAVCEVRPQLFDQDWIDVHLLENSLWGSYYGVFREGRIWYYNTPSIREFFTLSGKSVGSGIDDFPNDSVAHDDPIVPQAQQIAGHTGSQQSFETIRG